MSRYIRLTVHEKRDFPEMPAIFTLGPQGGNLLSQHVVARVPRRGAVRFETVAEIAPLDDAHPVVVRGDADGAKLFGWLIGPGQPLCFIQGDGGDPAAVLGTVMDA